MIVLQFDDLLGFTPLNNNAASSVVLTRKGARFGTNVPMITELGE